MSSLYQTIESIASRAVDGLATSDIGTVTSIFPHADEGDTDNYECSVAIPGREGELRRVPIATPYIGTAAVPAVGDVVIVVYVRGDVNQPVVVGRLYTDQARPPANAANEIIHRMPPAESDENAIKIEIRKTDDDPSREVLIELADKITVRIVDSEITAQAGNTMMTLSQPGDADGTVTVSAGKSTITMDEDGDIAIHAEGALNLDASGDVELTGANITIKSDQALSLESGAEAGFKAGTSASIEASADMKLKGATIDLN